MVWLWRELFSHTVLKIQSLKVETNLNFLWVRCPRHVTVFSVRLARQKCQWLVARPTKCDHAKTAHESNISL
jgi:hypothetical protein